MAAAMTPFQSVADVRIDFETAKGFASTGVYDVWEASPFRTGILTGNVAITANPDTGVDEVLGEAPNASATVLGAQRSRFGSNRFGVRIDLDETFTLDPQPKYVHVMLLKPRAGRVMLIGLGSRTERTAQDPFCEQFWQVSSNRVEPGKWSDAVFSIKGAGGIDIRSLVVVPDLESPHDLTEDFLFYVDNIEINSSASPRVTYEYYPVTGSKETSAMTRNDRYSENISITVGDETQTLTFAQRDNDLLYQNLTDSIIYAPAGATLTPAIGYHGTWMHAYCFVDYNQNGAFDADELVSFNAYDDGTGYVNSLGEISAANQGSNCGKMPHFTLPDTIAPGRYRMRLKMDWNSIDPAGNPGDANGNNLINDNGGVVADVMLNVYGSQVAINDHQLNGEVLAADGSKLSPFMAPACQPFTIRMAPEKGFHQDGADLRIGFNLDDEPTDRYGNPQWTTLSIPAEAFDPNGLFTLPASLLRSDILVEGRMAEDTPGAISEVEAPADSKDTVYYNLQGIRVNQPERGLFITSEGRKVLIN